MKKKLLFGVLVITLLFSACGNGNLTGSQKESESSSETESQVETESQSETESQTESQTETESEVVVEPEPVITEIVVSAVGDCTLGHNQKQGYAKSFDEYYDKFDADYFFQNVRDRKSVV